MLHSSDSDIVDTKISSPISLIQLNEVQTIMVVYFFLKSYPVKFQNYGNPELTNVLKSIAVVSL